LEPLKAEHSEGETERKYVPRDEVEELKANYWQKCSQKTRYHLARGMAEQGLTQTEIANILTAAEHDSNGDVSALTQPRISDLVNAESFDEEYSG